LINNENHEERKATSLILSDGRGWGKEGRRAPRKRGESPGFHTSCGGEEKEGRDDYQPL